MTAPWGRRGWSLVGRGGGPQDVGEPGRSVGEATCRSELAGVGVREVGVTAAGVPAGPGRGIVATDTLSMRRATTGREQDRVTTVADQLGIHPRQVTIALGYAADHPDEIEDRIARNQAALAEAERAHQARQRLLDSA